MMTLKDLDGMDIHELETVHDYLNRAKLPTHYIFRKAAFDTLCVTEQDIDKMKQDSRRYQLIASILNLLVEE